LTPDVTIIIPTYNRLWSLPRAISSCRETHDNVEIIVVDDGSTDGTWPWLQQQEGVVPLWQENSGKGWAVNRALAIAQGDYVRFLDSDDWLLPRGTSEQVKLAREADADIVVAGTHVYSDQGVLLETQDWEFCDDFVAQQLGECSSSHYSAYLFRRGLIEQIPHRTEYGPLDDRGFIIEVALAGPHVVSCASPVFAHRHHARGRLQDAHGMASVVAHHARVQIYRRALRRLSERGELTARRKKAATRALWPLAHWVAYTHLDEGCEIARWVLELDHNFQPLERGLRGWLYGRLGFRLTEQLMRIARVLKRCLDKQRVAVALLQGGGEVHGPTPNKATASTSAAT
jgi:glycosyltransferase involved in cell wall biosynthesis